MTDRLCRSSRTSLPLLLVAALACNGGPGAAPAEAPSFEAQGAPVPSEVFLRVEGIEVRAEVAADPAKREQGLMFRESLDMDAGMLFVFPQTRPLSFWMLNVPIPLSIAFLADDGTIRQITEMAAGDGVPQDRQPRYRAREPARLALEMAGGWFAERGIEPGDRIDLGEAASIVGR